MEDQRSKEVACMISKK